SAATLILSNYYWTRPADGHPRNIYHRKKHTSFADADDVVYEEDEQDEAEEGEEGEVEKFVGELNNNVNGIINESPGEIEHDNNDRGRFSRSNSILSDTSMSTSFTTPSISRRSFTIGEEEEGENFIGSSNGSSRRDSSSCYADNPDAGTNYEVITEEDWAADTEIIQQAKDFDEQILSKLSNEEEMLMLLRRTRAVNALAHTLTLAKDERDCYEQVSRLLVPLFRIDGCGFALRKDSDNVIFKHVTVNKREYVTKLGLQGGPDGLVKPLNETAAAFVAKTLKQYYCPKTMESPFEAQRWMAKDVGINTILVTPIIVNGDKFAGCILACLAREDGFGETDRMLIDNAATMLGAAIYSKRLRIASERSNRISREMLHSMIPPKVIEKIECFWDESTVEYQSRRNSSFVDSIGSSLEESDGMSIGENINEMEDERMNSMNNSVQRRKKERKAEHRQSMHAKVNLLHEMNKSGIELDNVGMVIDTSAMELNSTPRALYAETVSNACIIFTDIVKFSEISLTMKPIKVMDMLQDLFSRFDALCDRFGVQKLETIGDAYICTTGLFDSEDATDKINNPAAALGMAKEMIRESRRVFIPKKNHIHTLEIRVGIHIGEITCGVLGERLPKFTVFGNAVNLAARMEQTCLPSRIRVTKDFFDLLPESEEWEQKETIAVKNMGEVETYLLNPL
ncbi:hypothetical protein ACHAXR_005794, partial [Thalassiosira sp. AJA248-18]